MKRTLIYVQFFFFVGCVARQSWSYTEYLCELFLWSWLLSFDNENSFAVSLVKGSRLKIIVITFSDIMTTEISIMPWSENWICVSHKKITPWGIEKGTCDFFRWNFDWILNQKYFYFCFIYECFWKPNNMFCNHVCLLAIRRTSALILQILCIRKKTKQLTKRDHWQREYKSRK